MHDGELPAAPRRDGEVLAGKYALERCLGEGGMGAVYKAENRLIGRAVAIKVLRPEHAARPDVVARFLREARAANLVRHPHVVDVLDVGQADDGTPFLVQELLHGESFADHLARQGGKLSADEALAVLVPIAEALAVAHARGVIHRDLKPENVFLHREGERVVPKLLDFGISLLALTPGQERVTAPGTAMGTPAYMAPEQVLGKAADARADVWAFGVMLYECLSGALPFEAETAAAYMVKAATEPPRPLAARAPHVPAQLAAVVEQCLRTVPDARFADGGKLLEALRATRGAPPKHAAVEPAADAVLGRTGEMPQLDLEPDELPSKDAPAGWSPPPAPSAWTPPPAPAPRAREASMADGGLELAAPVPRPVVPAAIPVRRRKGPSAVERAGRAATDFVLRTLKLVAMLALFVATAHVADALGWITLPVRIEALRDGLRSAGVTPKVTEPPEPTPTKRTLPALLDPTK